ncbi:hypothetical protein ACFOEM_14025 [Paenalcaligenes hominis]|uniref:hypothetical protein n=1 Tax=Paenalcaligenes hominis TaxID=643674 RepID=UPI003616E27B
MLYISLVILLPLSALFVYVSDMSAAQYWAAVTHPRVLASYRTTLSAAFWSTVLVSLMGLFACLGIKPLRVFWAPFY